MEYGIGQKVRVRDFADMAKEYGVDSNGNMIIGNYYFTREMKVFCGEECRIKNAFGDGTYELDLQDSQEWYFNAQMLEDCNKVDEVVELRAENARLKQQIAELQKKARKSNDKQSTAKET